MNPQQINIITGAIHRSGMAQDVQSKNKIKRQARESMRRLIAIDISASLRELDKSFKEDDFMKQCGLNY